MNKSHNTLRDLWLCVLQWRSQSSGILDKCHHTVVPIFIAKNGIFGIYSCIILLSLQGCGIRARHNWNDEKGTPHECQFTWMCTQVIVCVLCRRGVANYLEGAVYEGFVQVDHHTVLAIVWYTDLWQEGLGWRLQRQYTPTLQQRFSRGLQDTLTHTHSYWECDDGSVSVLEMITWPL